MGPALAAQVGIEVDHWKACGAPTAPPCAFDSTGSCDLYYMHRQMPVGTAIAKSVIGSNRMHSDRVIAPDP